MNNNVVKNEVESTSIGSKLREAREARKMSRPKLSLVSGVGAASIEKYENDKREPSLENLKRLCQCLGIGFEEIMGEVQGGMPQEKTANINEQATVSLDSLMQYFAENNLVITRKSTLQPAVMPEPEIEYEETLEGQLAYEDWEFFIKNKGVKSRQLRGRQAAVMDTLMHLDFDEISELAETVCGLSGVPTDEYWDSMDAEAVEATVQNLANRIVLNPVYGDFVDRLSIPEMEAVANIIKETIHEGEGFIEGRSWLSESNEDYKNRLERELLPHLIEAMRQRQPVNLNDVSGTNTGEI